MDFSQTQKRDLMLELNRPSGKQTECHNRDEEGIWRHAD